MECLRPLDELLDGVAAFAANEVPGRLCNAVLSAVSGHPAFAWASEPAAVTVGLGSYPQATAFLTYGLKRIPDVTVAHAPASAVSAASSSAASRTCATSAGYGSATNAGPSFTRHS